MVGERAEYGKRIIKLASEALTAEYVKGYSIANTFLIFICQLSYAMKLSAGDIKKRCYLLYRHLPDH